MPLPQNHGAVKMKIFQDVSRYNRYEVVDDEGRTIISGIGFDEAEAVVRNGGIWREVPPPPPPTKLQIWSPIVFVLAMFSFLVWNTFK